MPARFRDLQRALEALGLVVTVADGTSHWKVVGPNGKTYPIPAHNGLKTEIADVYIRGVCRCFGIDPKELAKHL